MQSLIFYIIALSLLLLSLIKDRQKTLLVLKKTVKGFLKLLPQMTFILLIVGLSLAIISPETILSLLGQNSGIKGIAIAISTGALSLLPSFIAFPLGATLLEQGAGLMQVAGLISALMGIGILTFSMEKRYFGLTFAIYRNAGSLIMTILFVAAIGLIMGTNL